MIALTQERRQKRINWLNNRITNMEQRKGEIPFALSDDEEMQLAAYKDSLASLTAEPVGYTSKWGLHGLSSGNSVLVGKNIPIKEFELFTAPPVPEINTSSELTELLNAIESFQDVTAKDRWNESGKWDDANDKLSEAAIKAAPVIKRLNGLEE